MSLGEGFGDVGGSLNTSYAYLTAGHEVMGTNTTTADTDSYAVYLEAGKTYYFYLDGMNYPSSRENDFAWMALYTAGGTFLQVSTTETTGEESLVFTPRSSGFYDLTVMPGGGTGSYFLTYNPLSLTDDHTASYFDDATLELTAGAPIFGELEFAGDSDGFVLNLVAGTRYYYEYLTTVPDLYVRTLEPFGASAVGNVITGGSYGTFVASETESVLLLLSSNNYVNVGEYYIYAGATYSNTANLIVGGIGNNTLTGTALQDEIQASWGADLLRGGGGNDFLFGGPGAYADSLDGGAGADLMVGGSGNDTYIVDNSGDRVYETTVPASRINAGGVDGVRSSVSFGLGNYVENLTLTGTGRINGSGNGLANVLVGNGAANALSGGLGNDRLDGGAGNDVLTGGAGRDVLTGGAGNDVFDFNSLSDTGTSSTAWDLVTDFTRGTAGSPADVIDLSTLDANRGTTSNEAFRFIGTSAFSSINATGQLRYAYSSSTGNGVIYGSTDTDASAEFAIQLTGVPSLSAIHFVL